MKTFPFEVHPLKLQFHISGATRREAVRNCLKYLERRLRDQSNLYFQAASGLSGDAADDSELLAEQLAALAGELDAAEITMDRA